MKATTLLNQTKLTKEEENKLARAKLSSCLQLPMLVPHDIAAA